jgi:hypothetical protein
MAASQAGCEALWLRKMLHGLFGQMLRPTTIYCDNQSCIKLSENPVFHDRSKHIEIRYHFIRDWVQRGAVKLEYISTDEQVADILTTRESKREVELRKETTFAEGENASQSKEKYGFQTARKNRLYRTDLWRSYSM